MPEGLLQAEDVTVRFGGVVALDSVDLEVPSGQIVGLIGPNGAGKTTLFNVLSGVIEPNGGRVLLGGTDVTRWPTHRRGRAGIARTFQRLELFDRLTVYDNLLAAWEGVTPGAVLGRHKSEGRARVAEVIESLDLGALATRLAGTLPTGQARLVELARAIVTAPRVLLLDEPSSGLDDVETSWFAQVLGQVAGARDGEPAVLLVEHDMSLVMEVCAEITVLDFGQRIAHGPPEQIRNDPRVIEAYLGAEIEPEGSAIEPEGAIAP
ncbi:MAG: ABC transporter ATP-binding protein [Actinomycetota bacterium]|jgi:branched-chain amino acid transport system ATP-binding protein|nr:ABC transporter ATP-binding protein [Actinomycetota bacterium]